MFGCMSVLGGAVRTTVLGVVAVLFAVAGCGAGQPDGEAAGTPTPLVTTAAPTTPPPDDPGCLKAGEQVVRFPSGGDGTLPGVVSGTGTVGIVFGHEVRGGICDWIATAREYAAKGYRTLAFDFGGYGLARSTRSVTTTADVVSAAEYLATLGVTRIVLVGASFGGAAVVTASVHVRLPVAAVVSLSGSNALRTDVEPVAAAAQLTAPLLCVAARRDSGGAFATVATGMCPPQGTPGPRELFLMDGSDHGVVLYENQSAVRQHNGHFPVPLCPSVRRGRLAERTVTY